MPKPKYNPLGGMSPEEWEAFCKERGVDMGDWREMGNQPFEPSFLTAQRELLTKLRDTLAASVQEDQAQVTALRQKLSHLKYGGGS